MRHTRRSSALLGIAALLCAGLLSACGSGSGDDDAGSTGSATPDKLTLALVPSGDSTKIIDSAKPLTDYLSTELGIPVTGTVTQDYTAAVEAIGSDQAQIGFLAVLPMEQAVDRYGATPALQVVRDGKTTYHTQFFTNDPATFCTDTPKAGTDGMNYCNGTGDKTDGPAALDSLPKVKGKTVAFVEQASSSGYIFPALDLKNVGIDVTKDSDVKPIFTGAHDAAVLSVYNGDAPVGVSYDDARALVVKDKPDVGKKVTVFALSEEIPNDGVVIAKSVPTDLQTKITDALVAYAGTKEGKKTLTDLYEISEFQKADPASLEIVKEAAEKLGLNG